MSWGVGLFAIPRVTGSVGYFILPVVHVGTGIFKESVVRPGWLNVDGLSEFSAREESSLEQVPFHVIGA